MPAIDLTGQRFGKLVVLKLDRIRKEGYKVFWLCRCDCGNEHIASSSSLRHDRTKSCGCLVGKAKRDKDGNPIPATCHPEYPVFQATLGLCRKCYKKEESKRLFKTHQRYHYKKKFGLSYEQVQAISDSQNGLCKICKVQPKTCSLFVDHDHKTSQIRGLLCHKCNSGLGLFRDSPELLSEAASYLRLSQRQDEIQNVVAA